MPRAWRSGTVTVNTRDTVWKPHVTVAALCQRDQRFLLVRERIDGRIVLNQPAGHLEAGESLEQAVIREMREETAYDFQPSGLVGIYRFVIPDTDRTYLRFVFTGELGQRHEQPLDEGIIAADWLSLDEIESASGQLRTPMVRQCILDYLAKPPYPLQILSPGFR